MGTAVSRFTLMTTPILHPGIDLISGDNAGPVVDTGYDIEPSYRMVRRLYLSVDTIRELATTAGVLDERPTVGQILYETEAYNRGFSDAVKEGVGGQLVELVDRLGLLTHLLGGGSDPDPEVDAPDLEVAAGAGGEVVGVRGPRPRPRRVQ